MESVLARRQRLRPAPTAPFPADLLDACRVASLRLDGPKLTQLGVSSALKGEGRTTIAIGMAMVQRTDYDRRVILVDLDLNSPSLATRLGLAPWPGVCEVVRGEVGATEALQHIDDGISVITSGAAGGNAPRIVSEARRLGFLEELATLADVIVIDLPPVLGCTFGLAAAEMCSNLMLVVRARVTPLRRVKEAVAGLPIEPAVFLNGTRSGLPAWLAAFLDNS